MSGGLCSINKNLRLVACKAFYKWLRETRSGHTRGHSPVRPPQAKRTKNSLATIVLKNYMMKSCITRQKKALYLWQKATIGVASSSLLPDTELRAENERYIQCNV